jgi:hypothetical protein
MTLTPRQCKGIFALTVIPWIVGAQMVLIASALTLAFLCISTLKQVIPAAVRYAGTNNEIGFQGIKRQLVQSATHALILVSLVIISANICLAA